VFQSLSLKSALAAPALASVSLAGMYYLLQTLQLDIGTVYQVGHTGNITTR
jgi:hypothetical protein